MLVVCWLNVPVESVPNPTAILPWEEGENMAIEGRVTPSERMPSLKRAIAKRGFVRIIEAHSGLRAIVGEAAQVTVNGDTI